MAEITDKMIEEAKAACKPGALESAGLRLQEVVKTAATFAIAGGGIGTIVPVIGTDVGLAIGAAAGSVIGSMAANDIANTPDASCVAKNLQNRSR